jgi:fructosamine-3-kinase
MIEDASLRECLESALGRSLVSFERRPLAGGCINQAFELRAGGERWFVKGNAHPLPDQFRAEAEGLRALRESGTSLRIPDVVAFRDHDAAGGDAFLVLEFLDPGSRVRDFDEALGRGLAELHEASSERGFGFDLDGYCGATPQPNGWMDEWAEFYTERRIGHQIRLARESGLPATDVGVLESLLARLPALVDDDEPPALIHGDLWSGNLHVGPQGEPALIDPAAYYGHREAELGMMALFGGFPSRVWEAYQEVRSLRPGWRQRLDLYTLYHVLNHFHLFGGGYGAQAMEIARRYAG